MSSSTMTETKSKRTSYLPAGPWSRVLYLAPVAIALLWGAVWIVTHAHLARGYVHPLFQSLALAENVAALLLRRRKPVGALAGILVVFMLVDLEPTTLLPVLFALFTVIVVSTQRVTAWAIVVTTLLIIARPFIHGDPVDLVQYGVLHLSAIGAVVGAGLFWRSRQKKMTVH
jgi:hypothetical protein